jgi:hypothetical protein
LGRGNQLPRPEALRKPPAWGKKMPPLKKTFNGGAEEEEKEAFYI